MTVTTTTHTASPAELAGLDEHAGLDGLDAAGLLARVVEADRGERAAARDKLRVALDDPEKRQQMVDAIRVMMKTES